MRQCGAGLTLRACHVNLHHCHADRVNRTENRRGTALRPYVELTHIEL